MRNKEFFEQLREQELQQMSPIELATLRHWIEIQYYQQENLKDEHSNSLHEKEDVARQTDIHDNPF
jgi:uncharacterized membrane protein YcaP (DUF421 family)